MPGGLAPLVQNDSCVRATNHIFEIAEQMNDNGIYFPLFGICQGSEFLQYVSIGEQPCFEHCFAENLPSTLDFTNGMFLFIH